MRTEARPGHTVENSFPEQSHIPHSQRYRMEVSPWFMNLKFTIRNERPGDITSIAYITEEAFKTIEISNHTEQFIINALRARGALTISLVAEIEKNVIGHIAFSPLTVSDGTSDWYGLGPVSVLPDFQGQGLGGGLMKFAETKAKDKGYSELRLANFRSP